MYRFIDVTHHNSPASVRPTEAVQFNGEWLDSAVPGFRTLSVRGRESYTMSITDDDIPVTNRGKRFIRAKQEPRQITVKYMLECETAALFRQSFNTLHSLIVPQQNRLIFNDESDKFFIATCQDIPEVEEGRNAVTGELVFYCSDPMKYAVNYVTETLTTDDVISVDTHDITPAIVTVTANSNLLSVQLSGLSRNKYTGQGYNMTVKNLLAGVPVVINGETLKATENNESKFIDNGLDLKAFPTLKAGENSIVITKSSDAVSVTVQIKYRPAYV